MTNENVAEQCEIVDSDLTDVLGGIIPGERPDLPRELPEPFLPMPGPLPPFVPFPLPGPRPTPVPFPDPWLPFSPNPL